MLDEKTKKVLKIIVLALGVLLIFNLFIGENDRKKGKLNGKTEKIGPPIKNSLSGEMSDAETVGTPMPVSSTMKNDLNDSRPMGIEEANDDSVATDKKIIKTGNLDLKVEDINKAEERISMITKIQGGEVFATNFYERTKGQRSGDMTIKVPGDKFIETMDKLKEVATQVIFFNTAGQDVTEQFIDLQAQLKNKKAEEESFKKILERAGKISDVLEVTQQLSRVRGQIERLEGRIKYMEAQTDRATIYISLSEDARVSSVSKDWRPWQVVKKSAQELISKLQGFIDGVIRFVIVGIPSLIPSLIGLGILYWIGKKIYLRLNNK